MKKVVALHTLKNCHLARKLQLSCNHGEIYQKRDCPEPSDI
jgi:hypothetical protein